MTPPDRYAAIIFQDEYTDGTACWVAIAPAFRWIMGQGDDPGEAEGDLYDAIEAIVASLVEDGLPVPEPITSEMTLGTA
jgi:predicted RNase H-like HicB family nuclease